MEILSTQGARIAVLFPDELNPGGAVSLFDLTKGLVSRYSFAKFPKTFDEWNAADGAEFVYGRWEQVEISRLTIYGRGLVVDTRSSTDDSEKILEDILAWATTSLGLKHRPSQSRRKFYLSELVFRSEFDLGAMHPALMKLVAQINDALGGDWRQPFSFQATGIALGIDESNMKLPPAQFRIERRANVPFIENTYYSAAPVQTKQHVDFLREFEAGIMQVNR